MRYLFAVVAVAGLVLSGCEAQSVPAPAAPRPVATPSAPSGGPEATNDAAGGPAIGDPAGTTGAAPGAPGTEAPAPSGNAAGPATSGSVSVTNGTATLSPQNTKIQFEGLHSPPKPPDPRTGFFAKFTGEAKVDPAAKTLQSVTVEIDTTSLITPIDKLTTHLKSPDFFEVNEFPTAKFESTKITAGNAGQAAVTGNLTLHGVTKEISFPAAVSVTDEGLTLTSEFKIDRTEFGMTFGEGAVEKDVKLTVAVGQKKT